MARGSQNPLRVYSTKNTEDHEFLFELYQKLIGTDLPDGTYILRSIINAIEQNFSTEFECCKDFINIISRAKQRKIVRKTNTTTTTTKRRFDVAGVGPEYSEFPHREERNTGPKLDLSIYNDD